jgi:hypothetical protein
MPREARRAKILFALMLVGYLVTWLGAPPLARRACTARANQLYAQAVADQERQKDMIRELGDDPNTLRPFVNPGGPSVRFGPAIPVLPGVLLLDNSDQIGPRYGKGHLTVFLFYGFGVHRLLEIRTWTS